MHNNEEKAGMENYQAIANSLMELDAKNGLPEEIFLAVSTLVPIANVDLLINDNRKRILLSWRDDTYFGKGWHLPGGCIRFKETMAERIQKTALQELGMEVQFEKEPLTVKDVILHKNDDFHKLRTHHLAVLYHCWLPDDYCIQNHGRVEGKAGYLKWFDKIPTDMLKVHDCYREIFEQMNLLEK